MEAKTPLVTPAEFESIMPELEAWKINGAASATPDDCRACKGIRFKTCPDCKRGPNSFPDHREGRLKPPLYPTLADWHREGDREREQRVPDRKPQP